MSIDPKLVDVAAKVLRAAMAQGNREPYSLAFVLESAQLLQSPETAAELEGYRALELGTPEGRISAKCDDPAHPVWLRALDDLRGCPWCRVAELEAERHSTNEALSDAAEQLRVQRDRIAELEGAAEKVAGFCAKRAEYVDNINNCSPSNDRDYWRWNGHAEARRQLSQLLGLPVAWPAEDQPAPVPEQRQAEDPHDSIPRFSASEIARWQARQAEDPHDSPLHHDYAESRDLPFVPNPRNGEAL